jgi:hypothetical protein
MRKKMRALFELSRVRVYGLSTDERLQRTIDSNETEGKLSHAYTEEVNMDDKEG